MLSNKLDKGNLSRRSQIVEPKVLKKVNTEELLHSKTKKTLTGTPRYNLRRILDGNLKSKKIGRGKLNSGQSKRIGNSTISLEQMEKLSFYKSENGLTSNLVAGKKLAQNQDANGLTGGEKSDGQKSKSSATGNSGEVTGNSVEVVSQEPNS